MIKFKALWVARHIEPLPFHPGMTRAVWSADHKRMMRHIGKAITNGLDVVVTFRKPLETERFANAVEMGECLITGIARQRRRTNGPRPQPSGDLRKFQSRPQGIRQVATQADNQAFDGP